MSTWQTVRKQPYTQLGIKRLKCIRCGKPAETQWQICADGNNFCPLCGQCDVELNRVVLAFMRHPQAKKLMAKYRE